MRPIPPAHRREIANNDWYRHCIICGGNQITIAHIFQYGGKQISEMWNYLPLCVQCHAKSTPHNVNYIPATRYYVEWYTVLRMTPADRQQYPKTNWLQLKKYLDTKVCGIKNI